MADVHLAVLKLIGLAVLLALIVLLSEYLQRRWKK